MKPIWVLAAAFALITTFARGLATAAASSAGVADEAEGVGEKKGPRPVTLDVAGQARFGISITLLKAAAAPAASATTARVLDPGSLLQLDSELAAASSSLAASRAEAERTRKLFAEDRTASAHAVEAAIAQEQADLQRVRSIQRRLALEWGAGVADLLPNRLAALLNDVAHARAALIRVELPSGTPVPKTGSTVQVRGSADSAALTGTVLGTLPLADSRLQTRGVLAQLKGDAANLPIGQMLVADVPAAGSWGAAGVVLPRSALLRRDSRVWAYVQTAPTTFLRREVSGYRPVLAGWFVGEGFAPGDRVVAAGAAALLGIESPAPADASDN
ncbi:MAG: hypothetical protein JWN85_4516 [Gammaproteobacteria bacterium]|nr:hypothetical protein [Gammaproteobacteria bacterium]